MNSTETTKKAIVHVSGTLLRRVWWSNERNNCIVVRPAGPESDTIAFIVNQVRFEGPSNMVFGATRRTKPREINDDCAPDKSQIGSPKSMEGHVGTLNGFDNSILVYIEADESVIHVQPHEGDKFIPFSEFRHGVNSRNINVITLNPKLDLNC